LAQWTGSKKLKPSKRNYNGSEGDGEVLADYEDHPESECADSQGKPCGKTTIGLLQRRHVKIDEIKYIGKESNSLEDVEAGSVHSDRNVYTETIGDANG
jgi:hypothetical protein